jgi:hypothetical protein
MYGLRSSVGPLRPSYAILGISHSSRSNSFTATVVAPQTVSRAPLPLQGSPENGAVAVSWVPSMDTGGDSALTAFVVYATSGTGSNAGSFTQIVPGADDTAERSPVFTISDVWSPYSCAIPPTASEKEVSVDRIHFKSSIGGCSLLNSTAQPCWLSALCRSPRPKVHGGCSIRPSFFFLVGYF